MRRNVNKLGVNENECTQRGDMKFINKNTYPGRYAKKFFDYIIGANDDTLETK